MFCFYVLTFLLFLAFPQAFCYNEGTFLFHVFSPWGFRRSTEPGSLWWDGAFFPSLVKSGKFEEVKHRVGRKWRSTKADVPELGLH